MKLKTLILVAVLSLASSAVAQQAESSTEGNHNAEQRREWMREMRQNKHQFLARQLELTDEQREPFFTVYDNTEDRLNEVMERTRAIEREVENKTNATDQELDAAIDSLFTLRQHEAEIEAESLVQYRRILTRQQLFKLKKAERKFTRALMNHRRKSRR